MIRERRYEEHLRVRLRQVEGGGEDGLSQQEERPGGAHAPCSPIATSWDDLALWAAVFTRPDLARLLWERCQDPMRTAIGAARACSQIEEGSLLVEGLDSQVRPSAHWAHKCHEPRL